MFNAGVLREIWANAWPLISFLLSCSILSLAIMLERWATLNRYDFNRTKLSAQIRKYLAERKREQAAGYCASLHRPIGDLLSSVLDPATSALYPDHEAMARHADRLVRSETSHMSKGLTVLGTIGSVTPFVGLLGTVIGIINAFRAIGQNAGGGPSVVANGIAEALIATALGLFVAIPAVVSYNLLTRRIERITDNMDLIAEEVVDLTHQRPRA